MHGAAVSLHRTNEPSLPNGDIALRLRVDALYAEYAQTIDDDRLEEWPALFAENGKYRVTTDCETTTTGAESAVSASEIERPLTIGARSVSKYPGITTRIEAVGS